MIYNTAKFKTITISEVMALLMAKTADPVFSSVMAALGTTAAACQQIDFVWGISRNTCNWEWLHILLSWQSMSLILWLLIKPCTGGSGWWHASPMTSGKPLMTYISVFPLRYYFSFTSLGCWAYSSSRWHCGNTNIVGQSLWIRISSQLLGLHLFSVMDWLQNKG